MTGLVWKMTDVAVAHMTRNGYCQFDLLGTIPDMLSAGNEAGAVEQIDAAYKRFGGWRDSEGNTLGPGNATLRYPGDQPRPLIASATLRDETVLFFNGAWVAVVQPDGAYRVARID